MRALFVHTGRNFGGYIRCRFGDEVGARHRCGDRDDYGKLVFPCAITFNRTINSDAPASYRFHLPYVRAEKFRHCRHFRGHSFYPAPVSLQVGHHPSTDGLREPALKDYGLVIEARRQAS